jgi:hypothetical protein
MGVDGGVVFCRSEEFDEVVLNGILSEGGQIYIATVLYISVNCGYLCYLRDMFRDYMMHVNLWYPLRYAKL